MKKYFNKFFVFFVMTFIFTINVFAGELNCDSWGATLKDIQNLFNFCKIVVPLLIIGLSSFDFVKAVASKDDKGIKKAFTKFLKRLALGVVFFFLPVILNFLLQLFATNAEVCIQ